MASEVVMPRLGWTMEVGQVVEWLKQDGDQVEAGEAIFAVEADKGVTDVEALESGVLHIPPDSPIGVEVPVGALLAYIVPAGESLPVIATASDSRATTQAGSMSTQPDAAAHTNGAAHRVATARRGMPAISPRARRRAEQLGVNWAVLTGSGSTGRIVERDVLAAARPVESHVRAAPTVRRLAQERGVDLTQLTASSPGGRITRATIDAAVAAPKAPEADSGRIVPLSQVRRIISQRMAESARTVAPVTLTTEVDATELARIRGHLKEELVETGEPVPSFTDLIVRFSALALVEEPALNASMDGDRLIQHKAVNIGIAVDTARGLLVPVVRDAHLKSVHAIATESSQRIEEARASSIGTDLLSGGTFTVTNLGMFDIDAFTPIINLPECAVLGVGRIQARPVVIDEDAETVAVRRMMTLSLTFDHRLVDGAPAARFLQRIKRMIERPYGWLVR